MDGVLKISAADRRLACVQAEGRLGLQAASIEKDFWVCWTLREVAGLPEIGEHLTFKGGTSPSPKVSQLVISSSRARVSGQGARPT